jgi:hypothetical protein
MLLLTQPRLFNAAPQLKKKLVQHSRVVWWAFGWFGDGGRKDKREQSGREHREEERCFGRERGREGGRVGGWEGGRD